jgi:hypothetical protein
MADEYTVESALAELREMFPDRLRFFINIEQDSRWWICADDDGEGERGIHDYSININSMPRGKSTSLTDAMAQVKKWRESQS